MGIGSMSQPFGEGLGQALKEVHWVSGGIYVVVKATRRGVSNGNGVPSAPYFTAASQQWDPQTAVQEISLNNPFFLNGFSSPFRPKPNPTTGKFSSQVSARALAAWGGYEQQDTGGGEGLRMAFGIMSFGYEDGEDVHDLGFWNIKAIQKFPPYGPGVDGQGNTPPNYQPPANQTIEWFLNVNELVAVMEPEPEGPQTVYYVWGAQLEFHPGFPTITGDVVFDNDSTGSPEYYQAPFKIGESGGIDITIPRWEAFHWYYSANYSSGSGAPPPPVQWPAPFASEAQANAFVSWANTYANANPTGNSGTTLEARSGVIPGGGGDPEPVVQPEGYLDFTVELYKSSVDFKYNSSNTPLWDKQPTSTFSFSWGGSAPQTGASWRVRYSGGQLSVNRVV